MPTAPIAVMASGKGSNLRALLDAIERGTCPARVRLTLSDRIDAGALEIARQAGVPDVVHVNPREHASRESFDLACARRIEDSGCEWIVLAGYMRILSEAFVRRFPNRIINIHPSLLPAFPGAHAVRDALEYGVAVTGVTVHLVNEVLDGGPILAQTAVPVRDDDTEATLHARIHEAEHRLYPETLARVVSEGFAVEGRRVRWHTR